MRFSQLTPGRLMKRYKRFFVDVILDNNKTIQAYCPNTGAMLGLLEAENRVWLSFSDNPNRKCPYTWELVEAEGTLIGVNTQLANHLVAEALTQNRLLELMGYSKIRREVKYGNSSRVDFLLTDPQRQPCYVEVKNVHLKRGKTALFPDCVTARGARHLQELSFQIGQDHRAVVVYVVQREDVENFTLAADLDAFYAASAVTAREKGVEMLCYRCVVTVQGIQIEKSIPVI